MLSYIRLLFAAAIAIGATMPPASAQGSATMHRVTVPFENANGSILRNPLVGGLNSPQFSNCDLDRDGKPDLVVFDRIGSVVLPFVQRGTAAAPDWVFAPAYIPDFPPLQNWMLMRDYNCDGVEDIFCYANGGIAVYRGAVLPNGHWQFTLASSLLKFPGFNGFKTNIYVSAADLPAIDDIDGDGDLDVVTYSIDASWVEYYRNTSKESGSNCDSLNFIFRDPCWGRFSESQLNSTITLAPNRDSCVGRADLSFHHSGSTTLTLDIDGDGDKDAIIGDIGSRHVIQLTNARTKDTAWMHSQVPAFPASHPVDFDYYLSPFYVDVNADGKRDFLVSPNTTGAAENKNNVWYYTNVGTDAAPVFQFAQTDFLTNTTVDIGSAAFPAFFDYDHDGLTDIVIGGVGAYQSGQANLYASSLYLYHNIGTATAPRFRLVSTDWLGLSALGLKVLSPAFGDVDGDGDTDLILGDNTGSLTFVPNNAGAGNVPTFGTPQPAYKGLSVGSYSMPQVVDFDLDGRNDLVVGNRSGALYYYRRTTAAGVNFTLVTDTLGGVDTRDNPNGYPVGYAAPLFVKHGNNYDLYCGRDAGGIQYFPNVGTNPLANFVQSSAAFGGIWEGNRTALAAADINADGIPDFLVGNQRGGIALYSSSDWTVPTASITPPEPFAVRLYPNPTHDALNVGLPTANGSIRLRVWSVYGQEIATVAFPASGNATYRLDTAQLAAGVYFVEVEIGTERVVKRFLKE